jgi:hypothetical protein
VSTPLDYLDARLKARIPAPIQSASRGIRFPGNNSTLTYPANTTTTTKFDVPPGTLGMTIFTSTGFTSLSLTGRQTQFVYLSLGAATSAQLLQSAWGTMDEEAVISIVTGASQGGSIFAIAFFTPLPPPASGLIRQNAFPSASRAVATYNFDVPAQGIAKGIIVYSFVSASAGAGTVTFAIQDRDAQVGVTSNSYVTSAAIAVGTGNILRMYPGLVALANFDVSGILGTTPRIVAVVATAATTFATDYVLVP